MVQTPTSTVVSPRQLQNLRKGQQATIFFGTDLATREVIYSGVYRSVLSYFSPYCRQKLEVEKHNLIWIEGGGSKDNVKFAVDWMVCGGRDARNKLPLMDVEHLIDLFRITDMLEINTLEEQTLRSLAKALAHQKLDRLMPLLATTKVSEANAIHKIVGDELCVQLREVTPTVEQVDLIYKNTSKNSNLRGAVVCRLLSLMLDSKISAVPYSEYAKGNQEYDADMEKAMCGQQKRGNGQGPSFTAPKGPKTSSRIQAPPVCQSCKKVGHVEAACFVLFPELIPAKEGPRKACIHCFLFGHLANECRKPFCTHCEKVGHRKTECYTLFPEKLPHRAVPIDISCAHCGKPNHAEEDCWKLHPEIVPARIKGANPKGNSGKHMMGYNGKPTNFTKKLSPSNTASLMDYVKPARK